MTPPAKRAKDVVAWALVNQRGEIIVSETRDYQMDMHPSDIRAGWRIARVRITEITQEDDDGR